MNGKYLFEEGFDADFNAAPVAEIDSAAIKKRAHIANGGEGTETFTCPACRGRGRFISYAGRDVGPCFKCKGTAKISKGQNAAIKGKATKEANRAAWMQENLDAVMYANKRRDKGSTFYQSLIQSLDAHGTWTENQMAMIRRDMAKDAEFFAKKKAEREAAAPKVEMSAIEALFAKAVNNDVKHPVFRASELTLAQAKPNSRNPGAIYVTQTVPGKAVSGTYLGKIVDGRFHAYGNPPADTASHLMAIAANPDKEALRYVSNFSACGVCGTAVIDPVSVRSVIGPVCARKWGLEYLREAAREELNEEAAAEAAKGGEA
jgi:hypothetical protein